MPVRNAGAITRRCCFQAAPSAATVPEPVSSEPGMKAMPAFFHALVSSAAIWRTAAGSGNNHHTACTQRECAHAAKPARVSESSCSGSRSIAKP